MKNIIVFSCIIFFALVSFEGCSDFLSSNDSVGSGSSSDIKVTITKPLTNDSVTYKGEQIVYSLATQTGINFLELYVNDKFVEHYGPENSNAPVIRFYLDSTYLNSRVSFYLIYYDKNGKSCKSQVVSNLSVTSIPAQPYIPYNFAVTRISDNTINLSWKDSTVGTPYYEIWRKADYDTAFTKHLVSQSNTFNVNDYDVDASHIYYYKIRGLNARGASSFSYILNSMGSTGTLSILPPSELKAYAVNTKVVKLTWKDNSNNENYFRVERRDENTQFKTIGVVDKNITSYTDSLNGLVANHDFYYRIKAISSTDSAWSNEALVHTPEYILSTPTLQSISNAGSTVIILKWKDNDQRWANFEIARQVDNGAYQIIANVEGNIYTYQDNSITPYHKYAYKVRQNDENYQSEYSQELSLFSAVIPLTAPAAFTGWYGNGAMNLSWTYSINPAKFILERKQVGVDNSFIQIAEIDGSERTYLDYGTLCQQTYIYRIKAVDDYSVSPYSSEKTIKNWDSCR
jgi:hypothetical protein